MTSITYDQVKAKIIEVREQDVILDSDVAELYSVEVRVINQAIKRNPAKFPDKFLINLTSEEWYVLKSQFVISKNGEKRGGKVKLPTAFTERGLYMLATILKSPQAVDTTIAIINTFAQIKELTRTVYQFAKAKRDHDKVKIFENSTSLIADLLDNELMVSQLETSLKIKLPFLEISRKITKVKKDN
ncbi:MAG: ORF6N domain-containing protein [Gammaproteobacteria bacterium]|nr:ORF6N domain-containing protein [Gammaproteobacteria bacterium]